AEAGRAVAKAEGVAAGFAAVAEDHFCVSLTESGYLGVLACDPSRRSPRPLQILGLCDVVPRDEFFHHARFTEQSSSSARNCFCLKLSVPVNIVTVQCHLQLQLCSLLRRNVVGQWDSHDVFGVPSPVLTRTSVKSDFVVLIEGRLERIWPRQMCRSLPFGSNRTNLRPQE